MTTTTCILSKSHPPSYLPNRRLFRLDTILLADVMERFRATTRKNHELDPAHYVSLPGLTWDSGDIYHCLSHLQLCV